LRADAEWKVRKRMLLYESRVFRGPKTIAAKTAGVAGENATNSLQLFRPPPLSFHPPPPLVALHAAAQLFKSTSHGCVAPAVG